jgi:hypothetical protein
MARDSQSARLAEILAADQARRAQVEAEIVRKEAVLMREMAKLARINAENDALDAALTEAKRQAEAAVEDPMVEDPDPED